MNLWTGARRDNGNPPGYYIAHRWFMTLFGKSEAGQRVLAALCGVLTIPLIGLLALQIFRAGGRQPPEWAATSSDAAIRGLTSPARKTADDISESVKRSPPHPNPLPHGGEGTEPRDAGISAGLLAAWLFALSPLSVELSNEARTYSLVHLAVTLNAMLFVRWLDSQKWRDGLAYLVVSAAACFLHYFVVFFMIAQLLPFIVAVLASPIYHHRYGSVGLPAFVCLVAIVLGTAVSLTNYFTQPLKDNWRSASEVILSNVSADDCVLTDQDSEVLPLLYYAKQHGTIPARLYGLSTTGETLDRLRAVRFEGSKKLDPDFRDYTDEILTSPRITVALCVLEQPADVHRAFFERHGYRL